MNNELYRKLVDLYADGILPAELELEMEAQAQRDPDLAREMSSMRQTVDLIRSMDEPDFTAESYQRTLLKLYTRAGDVRPAAPDEAHWQYRLPMQG